jgi:RNA polymerase sigma-70 factor, ECF subfamily
MRKPTDAVGNLVMNAAGPSPNLDSAPEAEFQQLLARCRCGDQEAIGQLVDQFRRILLDEVNRSLDHDVRAKLGCSDVVQETLWEAQRCFYQFTGTQRSEFLAWLYQIASNDVRETIRRYKLSDKRNIARESPLGDNSSERSLADPRNSPEAELMLKEQAAVLHEAMSRLKPEYQKVIQLRNWQQRPFVEIGAIMDRSPEAARKLWSRALVELQNEMTGLSSLIVQAVRKG